MEESQTRSNEIYQRSMGRVHIVWLHFESLFTDLKIICMDIKFSQRMENTMIVTQSLYYIYIETKPSNNAKSTLYVYLQSFKQ